MKRMPRILVVEDPGLLRDALVDALRTTPGFDLAGFTYVIGDAHRMSVDLHADVLVTDLLLAGGSTIDLLRSIREDNLGTRTIVLTSLRDGFAVRDALALGVSGYVLKSQPMRDVMEAIETVVAGRRYISPQLAARVETRGREIRPSNGNGDGSVAMGLESLSPREFEVLRLVAAGHTTAEIARSLSISIKTIDTHRSNMYRKLALRNSVDLVRFASLRGIGVPHNGIDHQ